jgi:hypothetical protein
MELRKPDMLYMGSAQLRSWGRRGKSSDVSSTYENGEVQRVSGGSRWSQEGRVDADKIDTS